MISESFSVDPIRSGISYDKNNADYLNFFFDVFALAFKKNDQYINNLKSVILNNREMDLSTLELGLAQQANWDRNPITDSLLTILNDLSLKINEKLFDKEIINWASISRRFRFLTF